MSQLELCVGEDFSTFALICAACEENKKRMSTTAGQQSSPVTLASILRDDPSTLQLYIYCNACSSPGGLTRRGLNRALGRCSATLLSNTERNKAKEDLTNTSHWYFTTLWFCFGLKGTKPLMELLWGDESSPGAAVPEVTGLPPGVILHADNLQDVASFKGYSRILAGNCGILVRIIVKKSPHKQLRKEKPSNREAGDKRKIMDWFILLFSYSSFVNFSGILAIEITSLSAAFFTYVGVILRNDQTK